MSRWLPWIPAAVLAMALLGTLGWAVSLRLPYPYDLEWMEGGMLAHAWRLQRGLPLYPEPGPDWIPYIYPPGYPALLALSGSALSAPVARALSLFGAVLTACSIGWILMRQAPAPHRIALGIFTPLLFLGTWSDTGTFLDLARPDALALGLLTAGLAASLEPNRWGPWIGGLLLAASFFVKQPALAFVPAIALGLWARHGRARDALHLTLAALVPAAIGTAILHGVSGGTYLRYLLAVPASHPLVGARAFPGTPWELGGALPAALLILALWALWPRPGTRRWIIALAVSGVGALALFTGPSSGPAALGPLDHALSVLPSLVPTPEDRLATAGRVTGGLGLAVLAATLLGATLRAWGSGWRPLALPVLIGATALTLSATLRAHHGGFVNAHLIACAMIALGAGVAARVLLAERPWLIWLLAPLFALQIGWSYLRLPAERLVPTAEDREAGDRLVAYLSRLEGPLWSPISPWLAVQAGQDPGPHLIAVWDTTLHPTGPWPNTAERFEEAARTGRWRHVLDARRSVGLGVDRATVHRELLPIPTRTLWPKAGWRSRPAVLRELRPEP
ncbi:MAG: hypothetical protein EA397_12540 [Deltaproteobacteria bacterium]|nr:MAG: hypothetical protein EA397_12540 [Deltaproteobacteria bacterium]